ncbi:hypothetical protein E2C01_040785 [Portunus trituberculatus]|uniref:Uncharacterized protein n=1 Tax=Portunus trituberculatus TaxID=210409 RepID=A0A5B7FIB4_PORTR|nr:hypothetical protein [Portunus trituberculatus]
MWREDGREKRKGLQTVPIGLDGWLCSSEDKDHFKKLSDDAYIIYQEPYFPYKCTSHESV